MVHGRYTAFSGLVREVAASERVRCRVLQRATNRRPHESQAIMFAGPNSIAINLGNYFQGSAEGPLSTGGLLIIVFCVIALAVVFRRG